MRKLFGILLVSLRIVGIVSLAAALLAAIAYKGYRDRAQEYDLSEAGKIPERSVVYDAHGQAQSFIQGENRILIPYEQIPRDFINALLAREDSRFWEHNGFDPVGIGRAMLANLKEGAVRQGGSTITQQLVRDVFDLKGRTLDRKLIEAMLACRMEQSFDKKQILEWYANRVYFGAGAYGLQRAAQVYFAKAAEHLSLSECATLAGLIRSPNRYSPFVNREGALEQRDQVIDRMAYLGSLLPEAAEQARSEPLNLAVLRHLPNPQNYGMDAVRRDLELILSKEQIERGGLRIYTTLDPELQALAEKAVAKTTAAIEAQRGWNHPRKADFTPPPGENDKSGERPGARETPYLQAAFIAIDNRTGAIRALVGGRDYSHSSFDRAMMGQRQIGSTFKPFVYAAAFQRGMFPGSLVEDSRIMPGEFKDVPKNWSPENSDGNYGGWQPASLGLIKSRNTMSVRVGEYVGLKSVLETARGLGLGDDLPPYPVVFLGGFETTLKDLTTAYTVFPNQGERVHSHLISRIENAKGEVIFQVSRTRVAALEKGAAWMTSDLLEQVMKQGTAAKAGRLGLTKPAGGKTGTTNDYHDAWFVGYTSALTCGVWVGFDRPKTIMAKGYGSALALPIWVDFVESVPESAYPARPFAKPGNRVHMQLCSVSNRMASLGCERARSSYEADLPPELVPKERCTAHDAWLPVLAAAPVSPEAMLAEELPPVAERVRPAAPSPTVSERVRDPRQEAARPDFTAPPGSTVVFSRSRGLRVVTRQGGTTVTIRPRREIRFNRIDRIKRFDDTLPVRKAIPVERVTGW